MATGLDMPLNGDTFVSLDWSASPSRTLMTCIFDVIIKADSLYRAWWWFHHNGNGTHTALQWDYGDYNVGFHPYPGGDGSVNSNGSAASFGVPSQYLEIAGAGAAVDWLATEGSSVVYPVDSLVNIRVGMAYTIEVVNISGTDYIKYTWYADRTDMTKTFFHLQPLSDLGADYGMPTSPIFSLGGSKWRITEQDENPGAIFLNLQIYSGVRLSASDIVTEGNGTNPTTPETTDGQTYVFYRKLNPRPDDILDDSTAGNDPEWYEGVLPELWTDDPVNNAAGFNSDADFLLLDFAAESLTFDYNSPWSAILYAKRTALEGYGHIFSIIGNAEGNDDYIHSDFLGHDPSGNNRMAAVNGSGTYPTGSVIPGDEYACFFIRRFYDEILEVHTLEVYVNLASTSDTPDIVDNMDITGRNASVAIVLGRLNGGYGFRGNVDCIKLWSKALTLTQALAEIGKSFVVETDQIVDVWNFPTGVDKYVGEINGYEWQVNGTITEEVGPVLDDGGGTELDGVNIPSAERMFTATVQATIVLSGSHSSSLNKLNPGTITSIIALLGASIGSMEKANTSTISAVINLLGQFLSSMEKNNAGSAAPGVVNLAGQYVGSLEKNSLGSIAAIIALVGQTISSMERHQAGSLATLINLVGQYTPSVETPGLGSVAVGAVNLAGTHTTSQENFFQAVLGLAGVVLSGVFTPSDERGNVGTITPGTVSITGLFLPSAEQTFLASVAMAGALLGSQILSMEKFQQAVLTLGAVSLAGENVTSIEKANIGTINSGLSVAGSTSQGMERNFIAAVTSLISLIGSSVKSDEQVRTAVISTLRTLAGANSGSMERNSAGTLQALYSLLGQNATSQERGFAAQVTPGGVTLLGANTPQSEQNFQSILGANTTITGSFSPNQEQTLLAVVKHVRNLLGDHVDSLETTSLSILSIGAAQIVGQYTPSGELVRVSFVLNGGILDTVEVIEADAPFETDLVANAPFETDLVAEVEFV